MKVKILLIASLLISCFAQATDIGITEIRLVSNEYLMWYRGQYFKLCDSNKSQCTQMKMPKAITPIDKLAATQNVEEARATWLVYSGEKTFICAVLPNSVRVTCGQILSPGKQEQTRLSSKARSFAIGKADAETRTILAGELKLARYHSSIWWNVGGVGESACNECEDRNSEINEDYNSCGRDAAVAEQAEHTSCTGGGFSLSGSIGLLNLEYKGFSTDLALNLTYTSAPTSDVESCNANATTFGNKMEEFCEKEKQDAIKEINNGGLANCTYKQ